MSRFIRKLGKQAGSSPGSLFRRDDISYDNVVLSLFDYDQKQFTEKQLKTVEEALPFKEKPTVTWLNIDGQPDPALLQKIGEHFDIHALALEDILNVGQRPKVDDYEKYLFIILRTLSLIPGKNRVEGEQVSIVLGENFVLSFFERESSLFEVIRSRIRNNDSRLRKFGADYLAYRLVDTTVDHYFSLLEQLGECIEDVEEEIIAEPTDSTLHSIHDLRRELLFVRKSVWPLREVINSLVRDESPLIQDSTDVFLRDVYDHTIQVIDTVENFREMVAGMLDIYLSSLSNRMNEVMKTLTIMASLFIPLTFLAGIYGMNFEFMPELDWRWSYPIFWGIIVICSLLMLYYFKRKHWL